MRFKIRPYLVVLAMAFGALAGGCPFLSSPAEDEARLASLRARIEGIIAAGSCSVDADCDVRPIGGACGGASFYLAYAPATVDEAALASAIQEYNEFEDLVLRRGDFGCTYIIIPAPTVRCENRVCIAQPPAGP